MSFSPTRSGTDPARIAVPSSAAAVLGWVRCSTIFRWGWLLLNPATMAFATPSVAWRAQKCTVPVALTPKVLVLVDDVDDDEPPHAAETRAAATMTLNVSVLFLLDPRIFATSTVRGGARPGRAAS